MYRYLFSTGSQSFNRLQKKTFGLIYVQHDVKTWHHLILYCSCHSLKGQLLEESILTSAVLLLTFGKALNLFTYSKDKRRVLILPLGDI